MHGQLGWVGGAGEDGHRVVGQSGDPLQCHDAVCGEVHEDEHHDEVCEAPVHDEVQGEQFHDEPLTGVHDDELVCGKDHDALPQQVHDMGHDAP